MHETRFVHEIIAALDRTVKPRDTGRRIIIRIRLSPFSHVSGDGLRETFTAQIQGTAYKDAVLDISPLEYELHCRTCNRISSHAQVVFHCPACGSSDFDINKEREFVIESVEVQ